MQQTFFVLNNRYKVSAKCEIDEFQDWMKIRGGR